MESARARRVPFAPPAPPPGPDASGLRSDYGQGCAARACLPPVLAVSPYALPPFDAVAAFQLGQREAAAAAAGPPYRPRARAPAARPPPHSARCYAPGAAEPEYHARARFLRAAGDDWRDSWAAKYSARHARSPYREVALRTFDDAKARSAARVAAWERGARRERDAEMREYRARTQWIRDHTPVTADSCWAKHDPGIRIVPVDDRICVPLPETPFYNPGSAAFIQGHRHWTVRN
jgi:hypothetical protein